MFRDLKEYQLIQKIYEERVCISEEERYITKELEETFTEDELDFIAENTEEVFAEIRNQLVEEGSEIGEETIDEMAKVIAKTIVPLATRMKTAAIKNKKLLSKGASSGGGIVKKAADAGGGIVKKVGGALGGVGASVGAMKNTAVKKVAGGGLVKKGGEIIKKGVGLIKKAAPVIGVATGITAGAAIANRNKSKVETDASGKVIPSTASIRAKSDRVGGGNAGASTDSGGTQGKGGAPAPKPTQTTPAPQKKMSSIEKKNRARFGDAHVDKLKAKQVDFKAMRKGTMSKDDFIKKYPKSITAQKAAGLRDHTEWDAYDMVLEYLFSTEQASTIEEANYIMIEMDQKTIGEIVKEVKSN